MPWKPTTLEPWEKFTTRQLIEFLRAGTLAHDAELPPEWSLHKEAVVGAPAGYFAWNKCHAVRQLGLRGHEARDAIPTLLAALADMDEISDDYVGAGGYGDSFYQFAYVREEAAHALCRIAPKRMREARQVMISLLEHRSCGNINSGSNVSFTEEEWAAAGGRPT